MEAFVPGAPHWGGTDWVHEVEFRRRIDCLGSSYNVLAGFFRVAKHLGVKGAEMEDALVAYMVDKACNGKAGQMHEDEVFNRFSEAVRQVDTAVAPQPLEQEMQQIV
jgi:hypothetical protein